MRSGPSKTPSDPEHEENQGSLPEAATIAPGADRRHSPKRPPAANGMFRAEVRLPPAARLRARPGAQRRRMFAEPQRLRAVVYYVSVGLAVASLAIIFGALIAVLLRMIGG